jgi:chromosomal replication initiator protein
MAGQQRPVRTVSTTCTLARETAPLESELRAAVTERLGAPRFSLWFGDGVRFSLSHDGHALEVRVPNSFFHEWIQDHYSASLLEAASAVVGRPLRLSIQIDDKLQPLGDDHSDPQPEQTTSTLQTEQAGTSLVPLSAKLRVPAIISKPPIISRQLEPTELSVHPTAVFAPPSMQTVPYRQGSSALTSTVRPIRKLESFVIGPGNQLAHAAATAMAQSAGRVFNPLVIHSAVGLGKTHLLEGITRTLKQTHPGLNVIQLTAESFTNHFLESMRTGALSSFRTRYRGASGLIVDDVHFLAAKRATQDEFLHTFNDLIAKGAPIVLATDQHPRLISRLSEELVTRFLGGMVVKIEAPDLPTRKAILQAYAVGRGIELPDLILTYIAEHLHSSVRELEGALHTVITQALLTNRCIDLSLAKNALRDTIRHTAQVVGLRDVERVVCRLFQIDAELLKSDGRTRVLAYPRMLAMYLARKHVGAPYSEIGRFFGGRNHSTVISAEKKVKAWLQAEEKSGLLPGFETVADLLADMESAIGTGWSG